MICKCVPRMERIGLAIAPLDGDKDFVDASHCYICCIMRQRTLHEHSFSFEHTSSLCNKGVIYQSNVCAPSNCSSMNQCLQFTLTTADATQRSITDHHPRRLPEHVPNSSQHSSDRGSFRRLAHNHNLELRKPLRCREDGWDPVRGLSTQEIQTWI